MTCAEPLIPAVEMNCEESGIPDVSDVDVSQFIDNLLQRVCADLSSESVMVETQGCSTQATTKNKSKSSMIKDLCVQSNCPVPLSNHSTNLLLDSFDDCALTIQSMLDSLEENNNNNGANSLVENPPVSVSNCWRKQSDVPTTPIEIKDLSLSADPFKTENNTKPANGSLGLKCNISKHQYHITSSPTISDTESDNSKVETPQSRLSDNCSPSEGASENIKWDGSLFKTTVPVGWLSTLSNRKHRNYSTSNKSQTRQEDFVYCGPTKHLDNLSNTDINSNVMMESFNCSVLLGTPTQASEVPIEILYSGIALTPGVLDMHNNPVLIVICDDIVWQKCDSGAIGLAQFFLYLSQRMSNMSLLLDERNHSSLSLKNILDSLNIFQSNGHFLIQNLFVLGDHNLNLEQTLQDIFSIQCTTVRSVNDLDLYIDVKHLPIQLGGPYTYSHADWVQSRLAIDCFVNFCENIRHNFTRQTILVSSQSMPSTLTETRAMLSKHHGEMSQLLDDKQIANLNARGRRLLEQLTNQDNPDTRSSRDAVAMSYQAANDAVAQFVRVADERLLTLERHLLVKQFEQSCDCIFRWTKKHWQTLQDEFSEMEDSVESLLVQSRNFENFYLEVMQQYAKCDCLLSDAKHLAELGYISQVELTQRAKLAEEEINKVVNEMESKRQEVEAASQMLKFIDQAYSWALDGMKFVAMLNMESCVTTEACDKMLAEFDEYMQNHPSIPTCRFNEMLEMSRRYGNLKCLRQCEFAQLKCVETADLFTKRRDLIAKARAQIKTGNGKVKRSSTSFRMKNREKLDKAVKAKLNESGSRAQSPCGSVDGRRTSVQSTTADDKISNDAMSSISQESFSTEDTFSMENPDSGSPMPEESSDSLGELTSPAAANGRTKPVRKMLKKSASMPGHQMQKVVLAHSQSGITIGSPVQVHENIPEGKSKSSLIIEELIATEREYVKSLNYVIENYFPEMCRLDIPQTLRCKRNIIFGNIEKIAEFHSQHFLSDLEACDGNALLVAKTFQKHKENFSLYALYSKNKPQSDQLLQEHGNEFFRAKQLELGDKMDLASYLLKPVQRMGKYALLLHAMAKRMTGNEERCLKEADEMVKFQLRHGNDLLTMDSIRECDVNLKEQGNLLRQEQFVIYTGRRKIIRRVFLFEELILFSKPIHVHGGHDTYQYKCSYKTAEIGMTENIGDSGFKFEIWFRRRRSQMTGDKFVLQSATRAIKRTWVDEIRGLLWKQALRNKDHRKVEMSSMGIGSKPHLDLVDSSENTIFNRSVETVSPNDKLLAGRLIKSRTRASIAVSSFDHVGLNSKRPHSIISTSSSTSSVGSAGSQVVSSLTLAAWPNREGTRAHLNTPPMAYCDFHAIAEDQESNESTGEDQSSESPTENGTEEIKDTATHQYVTTHSPINL